MAGLITVPGIPALLADQVVPPPTRPIASPSPSASTVAGLEDVTPSPTDLASASPEATATPSTSPAPSPSASAEVVTSPAATATPTPTAEALAKQRDEQRLTVLVPKLQVALRDYQKKHNKYPISATYNGSWTNLAASPLQVLVAEKFIDQLPLDPLADRKIGYRSTDGKSYTITVTLEDTSRPGGSFVLDSETSLQRYVYTISYP